MALFGAGLLAVTALGRQSASPAIVLDQSISGISIGMMRAQVEAQIGQPASTLQIDLAGGGTGTLARYQVHGGELLVEYAGDRVVSIETTSPFYRTKNGIGAGTSKAGLHGFHLDLCSGGLWDGTAATPPAGVVTAFDLSGDQIFSVTITELVYYDLCEPASVGQELPRPGSNRAQLKVKIDPDGFGFVRSNPRGIDCPTQCAAVFDAGTAVTLTATPSTGATFKGWSGACHGSGACTVTVNGARNVTARFGGTVQPPPPPPTTTSHKTTTSGTQ
jgi:hypothetical protein